MTNTVQPHLNSNVFIQQSNSVTKAKQSRGLRQDKGALERARTASHQPAPRENGMRSHRLSNNFQRLQNKPTPKRKTVHLTLWVKPIVKAELQRIAEGEGLSVSAAGGALLEKALQTNLDMQYGALLQPIISEAITKQMQGIRKRLTFLLVRIAFSSEQNRSISTNILGRQPGMTDHDLNEILDKSSEAAKDKIPQNTPQLEDLIAEVEKWLSIQDNENKKTHE
jgi:hypothetical protein